MATIIISTVTTIIVAFITGYISYRCGIDHALEISARSSVELIIESFRKHGCDEDTILKVLEIIREGIG